MSEALDVSERPDDRDQIEEILAADARSRGERERDVTTTECATWRALHADDEPVANISEDVTYHYGTVSEHVHGGCSHPGDGLPGGSAPHRSLGVHNADDEVVEAVADALDERLERTMGDTTYFASPRIQSEHELGVDVRTQAVSAGLRELAVNPRGGLAVRRTNPEANRARWAATRSTGGDDS